MEGVVGGGVFRRTEKVGITSEELEYFWIREFTYIRPPFSVQHGLLFFIS